jgi:uncharacterized membrane protein YhhN
MNAGTVVAFAAAAVFAVVDWIAVAHRARRRSRRPGSSRALRGRWRAGGSKPHEYGTTAAWQRVEYVCKPATLAVLAVAAATLDPAAGADARRWWFVAALGFSLLGDVLLMLPNEQFLGGLVAFLVGHLCYIAGFWTDGPGVAAFLASAVLVALAIGTVARRILPAVRSEEPVLVAPVAGYMVVIGVMVASAVAIANPLAGVGAALFAGSDSMIAWDRFVGEFPGAGLAIIVTYHLGQALLVLSLLR